MLKKITVSLASLCLLVGLALTSVSAQDNMNGGSMKGGSMSGQTEGQMNNKMGRKKRHRRVARRRHRRGRMMSKHM